MHSNECLLICDWNVSLLEYKKASEKLKSKGLDVLAKVDGSKEGELAKEHFIQGFPTLTVFRYGEKVCFIQTEELKMRPLVKQAMPYSSM